MSPSASVSAVGLARMDRPDVRVVGCAACAGDASCASDGRRTVAPTTAASGGVLGSAIGSDGSDGSALSMAI